RARRPVSPVARGARARHPAQPPARSVQRTAIPVRAFSGPEAPAAGLERPRGEGVGRNLAAPADPAGPVAPLQRRPEPNRRRRADRLRALPRVERSQLPLARARRGPGGPDPGAGGTRSGSASIAPRSRGSSRLFGNDAESTHPFFMVPVAAKRQTA